LRPPRFDVKQPIRLYDCLDRLDHRSSSKADGDSMRITFLQRASYVELFGNPRHAGEDIKRSSFNRESTPGDQRPSVPVKSMDEREKKTAARNWPHNGPEVASVAGLIKRMGPNKGTHTLLLAIGAGTTGASESWGFNSVLSLLLSRSGFLGGGWS
jgi:hypothetical protein